MAENNITFYGDKGIGAKIMAKDSRILSTIEVFALIKSFQNATGLSRSQFAINGWGYPFIPIPHVQRGYGNVRLAPKNISTAFLGHPIYWINPDLTSKHEDESEQEWCIRMFYLIDAFGYWDEDLQWINFLKINDFSFSKAQIETYHRIADQNAETDRFGLMDTKDMDMPEEEIDANYNEALKRCMEIQKKESMNLLKIQAKQYEFSQKALGDNVKDWSVSYSDEGGVWAKIFMPRLQKIAQEYNDRSKAGNTVVSDLLKETRKIFDQLIEVIAKYNHATSILELPVKAAIKGNPGGASRIAFMAATMSMANSKDNRRKTTLVSMDKSIKNAFTSGNIGVGGFDDVINDMSEAYSHAWNRMRLAFINYEQLVYGKEIHSSIVELNSKLQSEAGVDLLSAADHNDNHDKNSLLDEVRGDFA